MARAFKTVAYFMLPGLALACTAPAYALESDLDCHKIVDIALHRSHLDENAKLQIGAWAIMTMSESHISVSKQSLRLMGAALALTCMEHPNWSLSEAKKEAISHFRSGNLNWIVDSGHGEDL